VKLGPFDDTGLGAQLLRISGLRADALTDCGLWGIGMAASLQFKRAMKDLVFLDPVVMIAACAAGVLSVVGMMLDVGAFGSDVTLWAMAPGGACAVLAMTGRRQLKKLGIPWSEDAVTRERCFIVTALGLYLLVSWTAALLIAQSAALARLGLLEVLGITTGLTLVAGVLAWRNARTVW
jgi:hypothetical protein